MEKSFSVPFQIETISFLFSDNKIFRKFSLYIKVDFFTEFQLQDIFKIACSLFKNFEEVPKRNSLYNELEKETKISGKIMDDYNFYLDEIYKFELNKNYVQTELINFIKIKSIYAGLKTAYENIEDSNFVLETIEGAIKCGTELTFIKGYDLKEEVNNRFQNYKIGSRTPNQIKVGHKNSLWELDICTGGGLGAGELGVIVGRTGTGKTIFLSNIAVNVAQNGFNVLYITLELGEEIIASRMDSLISFCSKEEIIVKEEFFKTSLNKLKGNIKIIKLPSSVTNAIHISNYISDIITNGYKPHIIIIDYIALMASVSKVTEEHLRIQFAARDCKTYIANKFELPVWSVNQSSDVNLSYEKGSEERGNTQQNRLMGFAGIAGSKIGLPSECTLVITMNQSQLQLKQSPQGIDFCVIKNTVGESGQVYNWTIDKERFKIADVPYK